MIVGAVSDSFHFNQDLQGGNAAVLDLQAGDRVWVLGHIHDHIEGSAGYRFSSFSGFLIS